MLLPLAGPFQQTSRQLAVHTHVAAHAQRWRQRGKGSFQYGIC